MKYSQNKILWFACLIIVSFTFGCKKYLEESNLGSQTAETYYITPSGFEDLVKSNYPNLRFLFDNNTLYNFGTDIFSSYAVTDVVPLNSYNSSLNSSITDIDTYWKQLYYAIGTTNNTLYWATQVKGMDATTLNTRTGEAKALRAYYYYMLAETFGDVPLVLERATSASVSFTRTPEQQVYVQIIKDLTEAIAALPITTTDQGRVTKGFAQHLLAKVYLTRGYKTYGGGTADFTQAATLAENLITTGPYSLRPTFSSLFDPTVANFQINSEVIFSVQYSTNAATNPVYYLGKAQTTPIVGNNLHQNFLWETNPISVIGRSALYNKAIVTNAVPDPYFFTLFDKARDSRYQATVWNALIAQAAGTVNGKTFAVGDTVIYYPDVAFTAVQKAAKKYFVFNPDEYHSSPFSGLTRTYPQFKKFRELNLAYTDNSGTRDTYVFRLGETYLIAAEAYLQAGNLSKALQYYNAMRTRAAKTGINPGSGVAYATEMQASTLTLDDILDERARELTGEELRWFELKRTGKLLSRTLAFNDEAKATNALKSFHLLRPIPQSQIDLNRGASFPQNPGY
ncbi:putative outer membrane starch-binding protein [Mucilaginibacter gracilis]|uniref:Putative outer membrane starch-binding protein n=1 Tax=Mucilaginibacter gracilis TaxID=423350 RepID=A0A495J3I8_9SPHI|nr:RagB/SusD family nutrient uptake outer membrane protein [Mucilaginibacter gracilis]RKR82938.1 putative outer membrane starch-binding protein [Mucilaginibacter gracilis]